jgi:hypothetical protein
MRRILALISLFAAAISAADPGLTIRTPMAPPAWALLER